MSRKPQGGRVVSPMARGPSAETLSTAMMYWGNHMSAGSWIFSIIGTLIMVALLVAAIVWLVSSRRSTLQASSGSANEILDRRLASGEITSEPSMTERLPGE